MSAILFVTEIGPKLAREFADTSSIVSEPWAYATLMVSSSSSVLSRPRVTIFSDTDTEETVRLLVMSPDRVKFAEIFAELSLSSTSSESVSLIVVVSEVAAEATVGGASSVVSVNVWSALAFAASCYIVRN